MAARDGADYLYRRHMVMLGPSGCGKTSLLHSYAKSNAPPPPHQSLRHQEEQEEGSTAKSTSSTPISARVLLREFLGTGVVCELRVTVLSGHEESDRLAEVCLSDEDVDAVLLCFDLCSVCSLNELDTRFAPLLERCEADHLPLVVLGCRYDRRRSIDIGGGIESSKETRHAQLGKAHDQSGRSDEFDRPPMLAEIDMMCSALGASLFLECTAYPSHSDGMRPRYQNAEEDADHVFTEVLQLLDVPCKCYRAMIEQVRPISCVYWPNVAGEGLRCESVALERAQLYADALLESVPLTKPAKSAAR
jgi:GTPase SAR1 family protein